MNQLACKVTINGEMRTFSSPHSISELLEILQLNDRGIAIEIDGNLIPSNQFRTTRISDGAQIEIVSFVGGG